MTMIGLLLDTLIVRSHMTPAIATLLDRWLWPRRIVFPASAAFVPGIRADWRHGRRYACLPAGAGVVDRRRYLPITQHPSANLVSTHRRHRQPDHPADTQPVPAVEPFRPGDCRTQPSGT